MSGIPSIVCWQPVLTDHQSHTLQALARAAGAQVVVMVARTEDLARKAQGWTVADAGTLEVVNQPHGVDAIRRTLHRHRDCVHLFGSPFDHPRFMLALWWALWMGLPVYLISEPYSPVAVGYLDDRRKAVTWIKAKLRPWAYRLYGLLLKRRIRGVFAISPLAASQYRAIGVPAARIHPFGYFVPSTPPRYPRQARPDNALGCRAVFVGNLIARKGLTELVAASKRLGANGIDLQIDVYGAGDPGSFGFDGASIRYAGKIPFGQAQSVIVGYDFLILPSRYDGWGVVVNESVLAGVPVVCSDRVGAGAFVEKWGCGLTYAADSVKGLDNSLRAMASDPALRQRTRDACLRSRHRLEPAIAGQYLANVIRSRGRPEPRPENPWYDC